MDLAAIQAAAAPGHVCDATCVAAANVECGCSSAPSLCDDCQQFFAQHPGAL